MFIKGSDVNLKFIMNDDEGVPMDLVGANISMRIKSPDKTVQDKVIRLENIEGIKKLLSEIKKGLIYIKASNSTGIYEYLKDIL